MPPTAAGAADRLPQALFQAGARVQASLQLGPMSARAFAPGRVQPWHSARAYHLCTCPPLYAYGARVWPARPLAAHRILPATPCCAMPAGRHWVPRWLQVWLTRHKRCTTGHCCITGKPQSTACSALPLAGCRHAALRCGATTAMLCTPCSTASQPRTKPPRPAAHAPARRRLLQQGVGAAQSVVDVPRPAVTSFADAQSAETQASRGSGVAALARAAPCSCCDSACLRPFCESFWHLASLPVCALTVPAGSMQRCTGLPKSLLPVPPPYL